MNLWLLGSGVALLLLTLVHIFPGGREIHRPMVGSQWPEPEKAVWSAVWHITTAVMLFGGLALAVAAFHPDLALSLSAVPLAVSGSATLLFVAYGQSRLGSLRILPQWIPFSVITLLGAVGLLA